MFHVGARYYLLAECMVVWGGACMAEQMVSIDSVHYWVLLDSMSLWFRLVKKIAKFNPNPITCLNYKEIIGVGKKLKVDHVRIGNDSTQTQLTEMWG